MATSFSTLPIVSLSVLSEAEPSAAALADLSSQLDTVFSTTGFAYLVDLPLTYSYEDVFHLCEEFFGEKGLDEEAKQALAKKTFVKENVNTYRGYFPPQPGSDNLKEGFEIGPSAALPPFPRTTSSKFNLTEANVWPSNATFRQSCETLYSEFQGLASRLLTLLAVALGQDSCFFDSYFIDPISTLRLLHYPAVSQSQNQELICTPHTDSGILTLLYQDRTGGLEVLNAAGEWIPAPYVPGSLVVNIGDLMARVSNGRYTATYHRVRVAEGNGAPGKGRYSVPFFFEPGAECVIRSVSGDDTGIIYGPHVVEKMSGWVEFQDVIEAMPVVSAAREPVVIS